MLPLVRLHRYHPAVYAVPVAVVALSLYYLFAEPDTGDPADSPPNQAPGLHRSNARRRRRSHPTGSRLPPADLGFLNDHNDSVQPFGHHIWRWHNGEVLDTPISRDALSSFDSNADVADSTEAARCRARLEDACLLFYLLHHLDHQSISEIQQEEIVTLLQGSGFTPDRVRHYLILNQRGELRQHVHDWISSQLAVGHDLETIVLDEGIRSSYRSVTRYTREPAVTDIDSSSEGSLRAEDNVEEDESTSRNLLSLLYAMAQDKNRREGFTHRGVTCNICGTHPIKGIRYRCSSCVDFDMCEVCEDQNYHSATHLVYKVRIPRSRLGCRPQAALYPGNWSRETRAMTTSVVERLVTETGFSEAEIEGYWEQFRCLASAEYAEDPFRYGRAIDRRSFEQLLYPSTSPRHSAPNLIYDRIFAFYDSNNDDLVGYSEFIAALSILRKKGPKEKWKQIFRCFDIDRDGYINRKDFLRLFQAHYEITREMTAELVANIMEDSSDEDIQRRITGSQPISASFTNQSSSIQPSSTGYGKRMDNFGDEIITDQQGTLDDGRNVHNPDEIIGQHAEHRQISNIDQDPVTFQTVNVRDKLRDIHSSKWPSHHITTMDADTALGGHRELDRICDESERNSVRRVTQKRLARDWQRRHFVRLQAIKTRERRGMFFLDHKVPPSSGDLGGDKWLAKSFSELSSPQNSAASLYVPPKELQDLQDHVIKLIEHSSVDFGSENLHYLLLALHDVGFSQDEVVENLKGYTLDDEQLRQFVAALFEVFQRYAPVNRDPNSSTEASRLKAEAESSSEIHPDRFPSQSIEMGSSIQDQSYDSDIHLEPVEEDVGQELLFQLAQEAMNELVDPFLKAREDLWLEARTTKTRRQEYREAMCSVVDEPTEISKWLKAFLKHTHITPGYPPQAESWTQALRSEASNFRDFMKFAEADVYNNLTSQTCRKCANKVHIGRFCTECGSRSDVLRFFPNYLPSKVDCGVCSADGSIQRLAFEYEICRECHTPSTRRAKDEQWLWEVLSGDPNRSELEQKERHRRREENKQSTEQWRLARLNGNPQLASDLLAEHSIAGASVAPLDDHFDPVSPDLSGGNTSPGAVDSTRPATPASANNDSLSPKIEANDPVQDTQEPQMVTDLEESVRAFDKQELSQDTKVSQTPLEELLHQAGFSTQEDIGDSCGVPTNELSDRKSVHSSGATDTSYSYKEKDAHMYKDPTLPQNRPDAAPQVSGCPSNVPVDTSKPDVATLRFWAALTILEAEDEQIRGGPGRLSEQEFVDIMLGERGRGLEYIGDWMNLTAF